MLSEFLKMPNQVKDTYKSNQLCVSKLNSGVPRYITNQECVMDIDGIGNVIFHNSLYGGTDTWNNPELAAHDTIFSIDGAKIVVNHMKTRTGVGEHQVAISCQFWLALFSPDGQGGFAVDKVLFECRGFCTDDHEFRFDVGQLPPVLCPTGSYVGYLFGCAGYTATVDDSYTFDLFVEYNVSP